MSHGGKVFYQAELSRQIGTPPNVVMQELARLEELGMVKREATKSSRPTNLKNLSKVDSPVWRVIEEAIRAADEGS
jgi:DNA-binding HxlR family transcriptional regulator